MSDSTDDCAVTKEMKSIMMADLKTRYTKAVVNGLLDKCN